MIKKIIILVAIALIAIPTAMSATDENTKGELPTYFSTFLSNGSTITATGDYTGTVTNFSIQPSPNENFRLSDLVITIEDTTINDYSQYGGDAALTSGLRFGIKKNGTTTYFHNGTTFRVKNNGDYTKISHDTEILDSTGGDDFFSVFWEFDSSGTKIRLEGDKNDTFFVQLNDSFTGLVDHKFLIHGYVERTGGDDMAITFVAIGLLLAMLTLVMAVFTVTMQSAEMKAIFGYLTGLMVIFGFRFGSIAATAMIPDQTGLISNLDTFYGISIRLYTVAFTILVAWLIWRVFKIIKNILNKRKTQREEGFLFD